MTSTNPLEDEPKDPKELKESSGIVLRGKGDALKEGFGKFLKKAKGAMQEGGDLGARASKAKLLEGECKNENLNAKTAEIYRKREAALRNERTKTKRLIAETKKAQSEAAIANEKSKQEKIATADAKLNFLKKVMEMQEESALKTISESVADGAKAGINKMVLDAMSDAMVEAFELSKKRKRRKSVKSTQVNSNAPNSQQLPPG